MDLAMPRLDGMTAAGLIRADHVQPDIPIIAVTAQASSNRKRQFIVAGMTDVLTKPASVDQIKAMLLAHCAASSKTKPVADESSGSDLAHHQDRNMLVDEMRLAELVEDIGAQVLQSMVARFEDDTKASLVRIEKALADADLYGVSRLAHYSAGAAAVLGLRGLNEAFCAQERAASEHDRQTVDELLSTITMLLARTSASLRKLLELH
jgi:CheY-like chemotaxis protein